MQDAAYSTAFGTSRKASYAAGLCNRLEHKVGRRVFDDWFLPSMDELNLMYENLHKNGLGSFAYYYYYYYYYWSSSESNAYDAWEQSFDYGNQDLNGRSFGSRVRPVRAF